MEMINWDKQCLDILVNNWDDKDDIIYKVGLEIMKENPAIFYNACKRLGLVRRDLETRVIEICREEGIVNVNTREARRIIHAIGLGKIPAIKEFRTLFASGLIEGKRIVEKIMDEMKNERE
jgi:hypothetical protein